MAITTRFQRNAAMLDRPGLPPDESYREITEAWLAAFRTALERRSAAELSWLFVADSHWRNLFGLSWQFATFSGQTRVAAELVARSVWARAHGFRIDTARLLPRQAVVGGREVLEAIFAFETVNGPGYGAVRLLREADGVARAWTISTSLDFDAICAAREAAAATSHIRDFAGPDWLEQRQASAIYDDRDPDVLIVGGGHAGISVAAEARRIGLTSLVVDRMARVGDNWRLRYRGLKLHNKTPVNHLR
jgi:putative flavoprotein involved in K+ transport